LTVKNLSSQTNDVDASTCLEEMMPSLDEKSIGEFDVNPRPGKEASTAAPALPSPACGGGWSW